MTEKAKAVQRMQDYIERHLCEEITLAQLAEAFLYSPWYSYRLFQQYTDLTPADYIRRLRLSKSALRLRDEYAGFWMWPWIWGSGAWTGISGRFTASSAAIQKNLPQSQSPFPCSSLTASYTENSERSQKKWKQ